MHDNVSETILSRIGGRVKTNVKYCEKSFQWYKNIGANFKYGRNK